MCKPCERINARKGYSCGSLRPRNQNTTMEGHDRLMTLKVPSIIAPIGYF